MTLDEAIEHLDSTLAEYESARVYVSARTYEAISVLAHEARSGRHNGDDVLGVNEVKARLIFALEGQYGLGHQSAERIALDLVEGRIAGIYCRGA